MIDLEILRHSKIIMRNFLEAQALCFAKEEERDNGDNCIEQFPEKKRTPAKTGDHVWSGEGEHKIEQPVNISESVYHFIRGIFGVLYPLLRHDSEYTPMRQSRIGKFLLPDV